VRRLFAIVAAALICATASSASSAKSVESPCPTGVTPSTATPSSVSALIKAVALAVPHVYSPMTNQAGKEAWRGYVIREVISLATSYPASSERTRLRAAATARCGGRTASASWAVRLGFPNAQSIPSSHSTAYFVPTAGGWRYWFRSP
jgi:hypothetical protein